MQRCAPALDSYAMTGNGVHRRRSLTAVAAVALTTMFAATSASAAVAGSGNGAAPAVSIGAVGTAGASVNLAQLNVSVPTQPTVKATLGRLNVIADTTVPSAVSFLELVGVEAANQRAV